MGINVSNFTSLPQITRLDKPDAEIGGNAGTQGLRPQSVGKDTDFGSLVSGGVDKVNRAVSEFETLSAQFAGGERVNLHELMVKGEQADMSLRLMLSVRNKVVEAYQEVMRLQV